VGSPRTRRIVVLAAVLTALGLAATLWLPWFGSALAVDDALQPADVALVLEGSGMTATDAAEAWRQQGLVHNVVIVEAPVRTHALIAYWSDFVRRGLAAPARTPAEHLRVVRSSSTQAAEQARAALPALLSDGARAVLVVGGGGIGSRVVARELDSVLNPRGISLRMVRYGLPSGRDAAHWYQNAEDRRAVLDSWLQLLIPALSGSQDGM
jgi:hypothetical protein